MSTAYGQACRAPRWLFEERVACWLSTPIARFSKPNSGLSLRFKSYGVSSLIAEPKRMSLELKMLALSIVLGLVQILLSAHSASLQVGYRWTATAREARPTLTGVTGTLERPLHNFLQTFPLFAAAEAPGAPTQRTGT